MVAVDMMEMSMDQIIHMISVRHRLVAAAGAMAMSLLMLAAIMIGGAVRGIIAIHFQAMFLHDGPGHVMEMAIMEVIDVAIVLDPRMPALGSMLMRVSLVMAGHCESPSGS
jgi:hypothetical protein